MLCQIDPRLNHHFLPNEGRCGASLTSLELELAMMPVAIIRSYL